MASVTQRAVEELEPLELEHAGWRSLCDGTAAEFYGRVMAQHGLMILANGMVIDRDGVVASLAQAPPWASYEMTDERIIEADRNTIVTYIGTGHRDDGSSFRGAMSSHYHHDGNRWQLILYQQTEISSPG